MITKLTKVCVMGIIPFILSGCLEDSGDTPQNEEPPPTPTLVTISVDDSSTTEGDSGSTDVVFRVSLDATSTDNVTVAYETSDSSATAGADYTAASGTLSIAAGDSEGEITVSILGDTDVENQETFFLTLSNPSANAQLGDATATMSIMDNDVANPPPAQVVLSVSGGSIDEGDSGAANSAFTITLDAAANEEVSVDYATVDSSATAGLDYTATSGTASIAAGNTSAEISVSILGDTEVEGQESFSLMLSNPSANARIGDAIATMSIVDNDEDPPPPISGSAYPGVPEYPYRDQLPDLGDAGTVTSCAENGTSVNGSPNNWVVVTLNQSGKCQITGSYFVVQNSTVNARVNLNGGPFAIRNSEIDSPGSGGALVPVGTDVLIEGNVIRDNGVIPSDPDHHGINVGGSSNGLWILENSIYQNSGDAIQFCHGCIGGVHDGPQSVYIAGNIMHDDEENAIDLKEFLGPVVAVCNEMYGYERGQFSGNGEAVRINDEGQQGQVWFAHNNYHDNLRDIAPYSSDAEGYFLDENTTSVNNSNSNSIIVNGAAAQQYYDLYESRYGLDLSAACP